MNHSNNRADAIAKPTAKIKSLRQSVLATALSFALLSPFGQSQAGQAILNLKDADLRVVIEQISKLTGKTFVIDPRVQGSRVTILSQHMMDEQEIYDTFMTILKINGLAAVQTGKVIKIMQEQQARQDSTAVWKEGRRYSGDEQITRVIKVDHVDATQMVPVLRALVPQNGHLTQYPRTNVIIIHDSAANIERMVDIIRQIDKASEAEVEIVPLKHASADEIVRILENLEKGTKATEEPGSKSNIAADVRTNSILLRAEGPARLKMRAMIAQLDTPIESGGNTKVVYLKYAKAEDLVKVLTGISKQIQKDEGKKEGASAGGGGGRSGDNYTIDAHKENNALVISAPPDMMRSLEAVVRQLDIRRAQVHVEAVIVEISDDLTKELGVEWLFGSRDEDGTGVDTDQPIGFTGSNIAALAAASQDKTGAALGGLLGGLKGVTMGVGRVAGNGLTMGALIRALDGRGDSNVLSTPSVTTMDNEEAEILVGQNVPTITGSQQSNTTNQNPFVQVKREDVGVKLKIIPQINEGDSVKLKIEQEVSSLGASSASVSDVIINKRQIKNTIMVRDGETIVLGGLIDEGVTESVEKVPLLGDIPWLGNLFKSQKSTKYKRNLMVFLKPTILREQGARDAISSAKYNYIRAKQLEQQEDGVNLMIGAETPMLPEFKTPPPEVIPATHAPEATTPATTPAVLTPSESGTAASAVSPEPMCLHDGKTFGANAVLLIPNTQPLQFQRCVIEPAQEPRWQKVELTDTAADSAANSTAESVSPQP